MLKRATVLVCVYAGGFILACLLTALVALPFLLKQDPTDQLYPGLDILITIEVLKLAFYCVGFIPLVMVAEFMIRRTKRHAELPLWALPTFGSFFPLVGCLVFPREGWPVFPLCMDGPHVVALAALACLTALSLAVALGMIRLRGR
jgi:hypothetical protein